MSVRSLVGVVLVCVIWGAGFSFMKIGLRYLPPFAYVGMRFLVTACLLALYLRLARIEWRVPREARWRLAVITGLFFLQQGAIFFGLTYTTAGRMGVILNTQPIMTAVLAHWFVAHDRLTWGKLVGLLLAISGVVFVFRESFAESSGLMRIGDLLALLAAVSWGVQNIVTKHVVKVVPPAAITTWQAAIASVLFFATSRLAEPGPVLKRALDPAFFGATAYIVLVATVFGFVAWNYLIHRNAPSRVTSFCFVTPIASVFFGWLLLGESISRDIILATALVGLGIFIANYRLRRGVAEPDELVPAIGGE